MQHIACIENVSTSYLCPVLFCLFILHHVAVDALCKPSSRWHHWGISCADPKTWHAAVGVPQAEALVARLVGFLAAKCSLFPCLARMLQTACPPTAPQQQPQQQQAMSIPETLASSLVVRFLSLKKFPEVAAAQASLPQLLCVPLLWHRCPRVLLNVRCCTHQTSCWSTLRWTTALFNACLSIHACSANEATMQHNLSVCVPVIKALQLELLRSVQHPHMHVQLITTIPWLPVHRRHA